MNLSKRNGIYYLDYKDDNGRNRRKSTRERLKSNALKYLMTFKTENQKRKQPKLLSEFMTQFYDYAKSNFQPGTIELYKYTVQSFRKIMGDIYLNRITAYHWDMYKSKRLQKVSPFTVNIELRNLKSLLNRAFRWKIINLNPFSRQELCQTPERYPLYFTHEEFKKYYDTIPEQWFKDFILFAVLTGMRRSEITNLKWKDIDIEKKIIHIQSSPTFKTKAGKKRLVPIHESLIPILANNSHHETEDYVFANRGKKYKGDFITHKFKTILLASGLTSKGLHFHSLRHTFASWLVQEGAPIYDVQKLMGHSTITVTEIYAHLQPIQLHGAVNKIRIEY